MRMDRQISQSRSSKLRQASIIMAKARALRDGLKIAHQAGYNKVEIEGDNLIVIQAPKVIFQIPWQISYIIKDVCTWLEHDTLNVINHIYHEANMTADWLSKFGHSITAVSYTHLTLPTKRIV